MIRIRLFPTAALVLGVAFGSAAMAAIEAGARAGAVAPAGEIVFTRSLGAKGIPSLYVMVSDGSHVRLLVRDGSAAAVAPDGRRIAFVRRRAIWLMRSDGTGQQRLTAPPPRKKGQYAPDGDADPAWSPDGRTIYFSRSVRVQNLYARAIFAVAADGKNLRQLSHPRVHETNMGRMGEVDSSPAPSPTGRLIVFTNDADLLHGTATRLMAVTPLGYPGRLPFRLPGSPYGFSMNSGDAAWAPDGRKLAYYAEDYTGAPGSEQRSGMYVSSSAGSRPRRLLPHASSPAWSPDGNWISFTRPAATGDALDIWLVGSDGTGLRQLTRTRANEQDPAWLEAS